MSKKRAQFDKLPNPFFSAKSLERLIKSGSSEIPEFLDFLLAGFFALTSTENITASIIVNFWGYGVNY